MLNNTDNFNYPLNIDTSRIIHSLNIFHYKSYSHPFYMIDDPRKVNNDEAANKYYLSQGFYWKLIIFSMLNRIDSNLLMCCDEFEDYI